MKKRNSAAASAAQTRGAKKRKGLGAGAVCLLLVLLVLPAMALEVLCYRFGWQWVLGVTAGLWLITFFVMRADKANAQAGNWRTPEATLHLLELLGGWPASFLAQRVYWHKVSKTAYQCVFWLIVVLYQIVIFDWLQGWQWLLSLSRLLLPQGGADG